METDRLVSKVVEIGGVEVKIIPRQADIVPIVFEQFDRRVDIMHVSNMNIMGTSDIITSDVDSYPAGEVNSLIEFARTFIEPTNFICYLDFLDRINGIHNHPPVTENVYTYRKNAFRKLFGHDICKRGPYAEYQRCMGGNWLNWNTLSQRAKKRTISKATEFINQSKAPLVININLDAFQYLFSRENEKLREEKSKYFAKVFTNAYRQTQSYWLGKETYEHYSSAPLLVEPDPKDYTFEEEEITEEQLKNKVQNLSRLINSLKKPDLLVVSNSQKPIPTCPPEKTEYLESMVLRILEIQEIMGGKSLRYLEEGL